MKPILFAAALAAATTPVLATDVGVSVSIGQPGFYGRIDIGNFPQPVLASPTPVIIQQVPVGVVRQPAYLRVPPGHQKNWRKYCYKYNACGQPVYFVQENWYNNEYAPRYREKHGRDHDDDGHDNGKGKGKDKNKHKDKREKD